MSDPSNERPGETPAILIQRPPEPSTPTHERYEEGYVEGVNVAEKPRARWAEPVWVSDTTYRLVNVGAAPAFDVIVLSAPDSPPWDGMPATSVSEIHIDVVAPGAWVDIEVRVDTDDLPERPPGLSPRVAGWPPISPQIALGWNDKRGWKPKTGDEDLLGALEFFGFERAHCSTRSFPLNKLPAPAPRVRSRDTPRSVQRALERFVQFERVLNVWLSSTQAVLTALNEWEDIKGKGKLLSPRQNPNGTTQATGQLRFDLDQPMLAAFVSLTLLHEVATEMLAICEEPIRQSIHNRRDQLRRKFRFASHTDTVRNYLAHRALLDWSVVYRTAPSSLTIEIDLHPLLDWAHTRDKSRADPGNIMFADFLKQYGDHGHRPVIPLRTWFDEMLEGNYEIMILTYQGSLSAIEKM